MVDLDVSGKNLADEGAIFEVALALADAMKYDDPVQGKVVRLEELYLKGCGLNAISLQALAVVIQVACDDLRDLDLSCNAITIETDEEVATWQDFLMSFKNCCVLRRLDLSGNVLGDRAFEILTRVYANEDAVDPSTDFEEDWIEESQTPIAAVAGLESRLRKTSISRAFSGSQPESSTRRASGHGRCHFLTYFCKLSDNKL